MSEVEEEDMGRGNLGVGVDHDVNSHRDRKEGRKRVE
jgi:hypothetical protein